MNGYRRRIAFFPATSLALAVALAACGDATERPCGAGTKLDPSGADACIPDQALRACAPGTKAGPGGANTCVPDGTVICGDGTAYDMTSGTCVQGGLCPQGQLLVNGTCTAHVHADAEEKAEPNDTTGAGTIPVPAVGAPGYVVHGCNVPHTGGPFPLNDQDPWKITVTGPALLDITAAGVGGLAAGFVVSSDVPELARDRWTRLGLNLVDTTSHRQVYLPAAGAYTLVVSDSRSLANVNVAAGSDKSCYFTSVRQLALPAPTPIENGAPVTGTLDEVHVYSAPAVTDGELLSAFLTVDNDGLTALGSLLQQKNDAYVQSVVGLQAGLVVAGTAAGDRIALIVDALDNLSLGSVGFTISLDTRNVAPLPKAGEPSRIDAGDGVLDDFSDLSLFWFDVAAGDVVDLDLGFADDANFLILDPRLATTFSGTAQAVVGAPGTGLEDAPQTTAFRGTYYFPSSGRYYLAVYDPELAPGTTTRMTSTLTRTTATPVALGGSVTDHPLHAGNAEWFVLDASAKPWFEVTASSAAIAGNLQLDYFPVSPGGLVGVDLPETFGQTFIPGDDPHGRIPVEPPTYLVRISQSGADPVAAGAKFSFAAAAQVFVDLGSIDATTSPVDKLGEDLGVTGSKLYYLRGLQTDALKVTIHPTTLGVATVDWLTPDEGIFRIATAELPGADVTIETTPSGTGYVAFRVRGSAPHYDLHVTFDGAAQ